jgi:LPXTG-site transpeptidase (sortase) family protein
VFSTTDSPTTIECDLDSGGFVACDTATSEAYAGALASATHTFTVRVSDAAGNFDTDVYSWTIDALSLSVTVDQAVAQADPTNSSPISFTVVFSETVSGFTGGDVDLSSSTAGGTLIPSISGAGPTYTVDVTGMTTAGTVIASIPAGVVTDSVGNSNTASASTDNTVIYDGSLPETTIDSTTPATSPTTSTTKDITFSSNEPATFQCKLDAGAYAPCTSPVNLTGLTAGLHTFYVYAVDSVGNADPTPATHVWTVDLGYPTVSGSSPTNNGTVTAGITQLTVTFSEDVKNDGSAGAANNPANYLLVEDGANNVFNTTLCSAGLVADDTQVTINSVSYNNNGGSGPFAATLNFNTLSVGTYRLFVCGTTSIEDLVGNELNNGLSDAIINFNVIIRVTAGLPKTGFPMNQVTTLPAQPADKAYISTDLWLEIPRLGVKMDIVGVPFKDGGWDVKWLDKNAGWLNGSAFPTWSGNSVITGHVWDALNKPGPFAKLKDLKYGDQIKVHAFGQVFTYEIRESVLISSNDAATMLKHEEKSWITLITCEDYQELKQTYSSRRMLRAVLVNVTAEK